MVTIFEWGGPNTFLGAKSRSLIELEQSESGKRLFRLTYGLQRKSNLTYAEACNEIGGAILHLSCFQGVASSEGA